MPIHPAPSTGYSAGGGCRAGRPKSTLVLDARPAKKVQAFLKQRAAGVARHVAAKAVGLGKTQGSLIAIERNALTYAGYTVWHQRKKHRPTREEPYKTMLWRPRSEWVISDKPTHEALITREEAERILTMVDKLNPRPRGFEARKTEQYMLTGFLFTPDGTPWQGDSGGRFYRAGPKPTKENPQSGKRIVCSWVDGEVLTHIAREIRDNDFATKVVQRAHEMAEAIEDNPAALDKELQSVEAKSRRVADAIAETGLTTTLKAKLAELEAQRQRLLHERGTLVERTKLKGALQRFTWKYAEALFEFAADSKEPEYIANVRKTLEALVERIELDPATRAFRMHYRIPVGAGAKPRKGKGGVGVASPRGFEPRLPP